MLGKEFNKTLGHYHASIPGTNIAHPEVYEVLHGHALILLQKMSEEFGEVIKVLVLEVKTGQKVIYPPNYGHILVNIGSGPLVTANWLSTDYKPLYDPVKNKHGMAYYVVPDPEKRFEFVPNPSYDQHPDVRMITTDFMKPFGIMGSVPMYVSGMNNPELLAFLNAPEKYAIELSAITS